MLHFRREIPEIVARPEAADDLGVPACRGGIVPAEILIRNRSALAVRATKLRKSQSGT